MFKYFIVYEDGNSINNIEGYQFIKAERLKKLWINANKIDAKRFEKAILTYYY
jgi:hypothetical protein